MPNWRRDPGELKPGAYDELVSQALRQKLDELTKTHHVETITLKEEDELDEQVLACVRDAFRLALDSQKKTGDKIALAQEVLALLAKSSGTTFRIEETRLRSELLRSILERTPTGQPPEFDRPRGSLLASALVTNAHGNSVLSHIESEFASADRIDLLCAFIKLSGIEKYRAAIERHLARGRPLRVLTTTYMRASDAKAIETLHRMGAEIRISYDESATRLHAKAWLFGRDSGYSTAYVGSSNLSHAAQTEGLEWNVRIAQATQPELFEEMSRIFGSYWLKPEMFQEFDGSELARVRLRRALEEPESTHRQVLFDLEPRDWQRPILDELATARSLGRNKNLVVAATGTGKTLIAGFDYQRLQRTGSIESLLFVAHRKEILQQARTVFRQVLRLEYFGEMWVDGSTPTDFRHVFASVQSLAAAETIDPEKFDMVIVDEVHHAAARTYRDLLSTLRPRQLLGLSATPERADGRLYDEFFPRPYVGNLRVWDAIQQQILVPFRYYALDVEGLDLGDLKWERGAYVDSELSSALIRAADLWTRSIALAIEERIARPRDVRGLAFCVDREHARVVAERLTKDVGLSARALTHETPGRERDQAKQDLTSGRVQVLCVVDLFNEGVDIPDVNTVFFFRPTESAALFLQQLGRGLRRSPAKDMLTVFDATGRQHPRFRFDRHLRDLLGHTPRELREFLETGQGRLPSGCVFHFAERARQDILDRVRRAIPTSIDGIRQLLEAHRGEGWDLATFLRETEIDLQDLYRSRRSWTSLRREVGILRTPTAGEAEDEALGNIQKLLHVTDRRRLDSWKELLALKKPTTEASRRLAAMLCVVLYGKYESGSFEEISEQWRHHELLRAELAELLVVLEQRADTLPHEVELEPDVPLVLHACYLDLELSAAFHAVTGKGGYRNFYQGVEPVADGRYDLLLVTLDKSSVKREHLNYRNFLVNERLFHWQSQAGTRQDDSKGKRHLRPDETNVTPLLFVREAKKDSRQVTQAFRYLGPVKVHDFRGERPISIEWELPVPLPPEFVRNWTNVA